MMTAQIAVTIAAVTYFIWSASARYSSRLNETRLPIAGAGERAGIRTPRVTRIAKEGIGLTSVADHFLVGSSRFFNL